MAEVYADHAISGASVLRPGYQRLLEDMRAGRFDLVLAEGLDRLSRDQEHTAGLFKQLAFAGVRLVTVAEGEIGELHVGLKGTMNALYLKDLAQKTHRGLRGRVGQGRSGGGLLLRLRRGAGPAGPDGCPSADAPDRARRGRDRAADLPGVRRRAVGPRAIAQALNREAIPGPHGGDWGAEHDRAATPPAAPASSTTSSTSAGWSGTGCATSRTRAPASGCRGSTIPSSGWSVEVPELRIVDDELWQAVKARQAAIRASKASPRRAPGRVLGPAPAALPVLRADALRRAAAAASPRSACTISAARPPATRAPAPTC